MSLNGFGAARQVLKPEAVSAENASAPAPSLCTNPSQGLLPESGATQPVHPAEIPPFVRPASLKSFLDFWLALVLLPFALCLIAVSAILIKLEDGGPVFHRRRVVGRDGDFDAFKLRTMRVDADEVLRREPTLAAEFSSRFKLSNDPRVTQIGRHLRRWSVDELPQLFNVLRGEMALVGPRMITAAELEKYGTAGAIFSSFKPGITGYWQVNGRQKLSYEQRVKMDVFYAQSWSLLFDFRILAITVWKVLKQEGAY
jgi:lipopolysaccharide/colanic/teichoic acid biosynthesis glycosyltransferase